MKKFKLIFTSLVCALLLTFAFLGNVKINAKVNTSSELEVIGAQIRTSDPVGLRFVGKVNNYDVTGVTEYGMVLAFGKTNATENFVLGGTVNGKTVINGEVKNTNEGEYTVTLIKIPENMYVQDVSARAYVKKGTEVVYGSSVVTKSLANGALVSKTNGIESTVIDGIINYVNTNYKIEGTNYNGKKEFLTSLIEDKYYNLEKEFLNDWNRFFNISLNDIDATFHESAKIGVEATNCKNSNLYKFFNDVQMKNKWDWLFDFILSKSTGLAHPIRQITAIRSVNGYYEDEYGDGMNNLEHLDYSLINFFNNTAINSPRFDMLVKFGSNSDYAQVKDYSKIYIDLNNYELLDLNKEYRIVYNLRGRTWGVNNKNDYIVEFMKDFYEFLGKPGTLNEFMYGGDTPNQFQGTWIKHISTDMTGNNLVLNNDITLSDENYFFNSTKYKAKWKPLADIIANMNNDPRFGLAKTTFYGPSLDLQRYIHNETNSNYNDKFYSYDENYNAPTVLTYKYSNEVVTLHTPLDKDFIGWYDNPDFLGEPITEIKAHSLGNFEVYAKYKGDVAKAELVDFYYDGTPVKYRGTNTIVKIPNMYIQPDEQMRAVWVSPLVGDYRPSPNETTMKQNLLEVLSVLEKYNLNTINFHIRIANDALFDTDTAPIHPDLGSRSTFAKWDYLTWFIDECHSRGIEFHAWMNPYRIKSYGYKLDATTQTVANDYVNYPKNPASNPENILMTYRSDGKSQGAILNPCKTEVQDYIVNTCLEVMQKYDVDAIHFDDYFYAQMSAGIDVLNEPDQGDYELFIDNNPNCGYSKNSASDKKQWRRDNIDNFIFKLSTAMRKFNKENKRAVQLGIAPTGIYKNGNGSVASGSNTAGQQHYESYLFCDTKKWILNEWIDYICPQSYWGFTHKVAGYADVMDWWDKVVDGKKVNLYSGIGLYMNGENVSDSWKYQPYEVSNQILYTTKLKNCKGVSFFAYKQLKNYGSNSNNTTYLGLERLRTEYWTYKVKTPTTFADSFLN